MCRRPGRRRPAGRSRRDARGSGASGRSPAARAGARARQELDHLEVCDRVLRRVGVQRAAGRVAPVAADRRLDPPAARPRAAADEREVLALEPAPLHERPQALVRLLALRDDDQPRRVAVEAVDDPRRSGSPPARPGDPLRERAGRVSGARVHDEPGRLVDDERGARPRTRSAGRAARSPGPARPGARRPRPPLRRSGGGSSPGPSRRPGRRRRRSAARRRRASRPSSATNRSSRSPDGRLRNAMPGHAGAAARGRPRRGPRAGSPRR